MSKLAIYCIKVIENYIYSDIIINKDIENVDLIMSNKLQIIYILIFYFRPICMPIKSKKKLRCALE